MGGFRDRERVLRLHAERRRLVRSLRTRGGRLLDRRPGGLRRQRHRAGSPDQPLFLYLAPTAPHGPSTPAPRDIGTVLGGKTHWPPNFNERDVGDKPGYLRALPFLDERKQSRRYVQDGGGPPRRGRRGARRGRRAPLDRQAGQHAHHVRVRQRDRVRRASLDVQARPVRGVDPDPAGDPLGRRRAARLDRPPRGRQHRCGADLRGGGRCRPTPGRRPLPGPDPAGRRRLVEAVVPPGAPHVLRDPPQYSADLLRRPESAPRLRALRVGVRGVLRPAYGIPTSCTTRSESRPTGGSRSYATPPGVCASHVHPACHPSERFARPVGLVHDGGSDDARRGAMSMPRYLFQVSYTHDRTNPGNEEGRWVQPRRPRRQDAGRPRRLPRGVLLRLRRGRRHRDRRPSRQRDGGGDPGSRSRPRVGPPPRRRCC